MRGGVASRGGRLSVAIGVLFGALAACPTAVPTVGAQESEVLWSYDTGG